MVTRIILSVFLILQNQLALLWPFIGLTELSQVHNKHIFNWLSFLDSVAALDFVACQSKKAAKPAVQRMMVSSSSKRANIWNILHSLLVFALFEDVMLSCCETAGYVRFALFTCGYGYSPPLATLAWANFHFLNAKVQLALLLHLDCRINMSLIVLLMINLYGRCFAL